MPLSSNKVIPARVAQRALTKFVVDPATGCHVSTYSVASHGYAQVGWHVGDGRNDGTTVHRAAWTAVHGQIAAGMTIDHDSACHKKCVNVTHLRELTNLENARRTSGRDWPLGECVNGHSDAIYWRKPSSGGKGYCHACRMNIQRIRRAAAKASRLVHQTTASP